MRRFILLILMVFLMTIAQNCLAATYGRLLCGQSWISCIKIKSGQSWQKLWPNPYQRDLVKRINRMNTELSPGMLIAVPTDLNMDPLQVSPLAIQIRPLGAKTIIVALSALAWGAYSPEGQLVKWGPLSGGKDFCPDVNRRCRSKLGIHTVYEKRGAGCISTKFPVGEGGAPMPYCMFYYGGYALHGSPAVPGYHASHGCVRLFIEDARWLNQDFIDDDKNVRVIVLPYGISPGQSSLDIDEGEDDTEEL